MRRAVAVLFRGSISLWLFSLALLPTSAQTFAVTNIGSVAVPLSVTDFPGGFDLIASGGDIGGTNDQFGFYYQTFSGDFDLRVRVEVLRGADNFAKAGLVARETLSAGSRSVGALATPSLMGTFFASRVTTNGPTANVGAFPVNYPGTWLRLRRAGNVFTGYASYDGQVWSRLGTTTTNLANDLFVGCGLSSHGNVAGFAALRDFGDVSAGTSGTPMVNLEPPGPSSRKTGLVITEIMYKPAPREDGRILDFVELFNSNPFWEDISGYRLSGGVDFTFPSNTVLQGGALLVIAKSPADVQAVYGITNIIGSYSNNLETSSTVRLRNDSGHIYLEVSYQNFPPWPVGADGTGHTFTLLRPSYGEGQPQAWGISDQVGGSPGRLDSVRSEAQRNVVINEFLAHSAEGQVDYIELYNHSNQDVNLSGCVLTDDAETNKFVFPSGTQIPARGFFSVDQTQLGFGLHSGGERIYFWNAERTRLLDVVAFDAQASGVSSGRHPDGADTIYPFRERTPGTANSAILIRDIVINEIMYKPISGDNDHEYVELYNQGSNTVDIGGWQFVSGIRYTFPTGTLLAPGGYLVVAENRNQLLAKYGAALNPSITVGNYDGSLANRGERLALAMPDIAYTTNSQGQVSNEVVYVVVDEVTYINGGNWGNWANEGGSSLELIDPRGDHRLAYNWGDSDETTKAPWTTIEFTGPLDLGGDNPNFFEVFALGEGEYLLDNAEVIRNGTNLLSAANSTFDGGIGSWLSRGTHIRSSLSTTGGVGGGNCLHIRASARGDSMGNRNLCPISPAPAPGQIVTLRAQVRWLRGWPELLIRLHGNYIEAADALRLPPNLGTPGALNSRARANAAPAIYHVAHSPVVPAVGESVVVTARAHDPDGVASLILKYRTDPLRTYTNVIMLDDGTSGDAIANDGVFSGIIPGQPINTMVAFYVEATDAAPSPLQSVFPQNAPQFEALVRFGDPVVAGAFGTYRQWYTQLAVSNWSARPVLSNERVFGTFVYGNFRAVYNASGKYSGSPYHQEFTSPVTSSCHYSLELPLDDILLGTENFNKIHAPGNNAFGDEIAQREQTCYWLARKMGLPWNYRRFVNMFVNGNRRGGTSNMMEDTETPGNDVVESRFPEDPDGRLYKLQPWFEQDDVAAGQSQPVKNQSWCTLLKFTSGGQHKKARYRWNYLVRAADTTANDYSPVFSLIDAMSAPNLNHLTYFNGVKQVANIEQWMRTFAVCHAAGDWDHFGTQNSQNMYGYVRSDGRWELMIWDFNIVLGHSSSWGPGENLFTTTGGDTSMANLYSSSSTGNLYVRRAYLRSLKELATGPMAAANINPVMQAKYDAMLGSGVTPVSPAAVMQWIASARSSILTQVNALDSPNFVLATNSISTNNNLIAITGVAPLELETMRVNGVEYPLLWTSSRNFVLRVPLATPDATLVLQGYDWRGNALASVSNVVSATYTGSFDQPENALVFNEIMFNHLVTNASYVEFINTSTNVGFDISGWRVNGLGFTFPQGSIIPSSQTLLVVKDRGAFYSAFPNLGAYVAGVFDGNLDRDGETLTLIKPGPTPAEDVIVDRVRYEAVAPWPQGATNGTASLQLTDARQDNARVSNWSDGTVWRFFSFTNNLNAGSNRFLIYLAAPAEIYIDDISLVAGNVPEIGPNLIRNGDFEGPLLTAGGGPWNFFNPNALTNTIITPEVRHSGNGGLKFVQTIGGAVAYMYQDALIIPATGQYTLSFRYRPITNNTTLTLRVNALFQTAPNVRGNFSSPGAPNTIASSLPPYPPLWLNEVQPNNVNGIRDSSGVAEPWIELYNAGSNTVSLAGLFLSDNYATNLTQWAFPFDAAIGPGEFRIIWGDGDPEETSGTNWHTGFRLHPSSGTLALSRMLGEQPQIIDYLTYRSVGPNLSYGDYPDGQPFYRTVFYTVTPGATNQARPGAIFINEWLASNQNGLVDPADNDRDDWFELFNPNDHPVDLSGYYLSDTLTNKTHSRIPNGYSVPARGFLLVWADNETGQNNSTRPDLHASFDLRRAGEAITLFAPDGAVIDSVTFLDQTTDVSEGRYPDGAPHRYAMTTLTPKTNNFVPGLANTPPVLGPLAAAIVDEGRRFTFRATASDFDAPSQALTFSLDAGAPAGAQIMPNGEFRWTPTEAQGPGAWSITVRVTDNGSPVQSDWRSFDVTVREVNRRPYFSNTQGKYIKAGSTLSFLTGFDGDVPANSLLFSIDANSPEGVNVDPTTGLLSWTPVDAQVGAYNIPVYVSDDGVPSLSSAHSYQIYVFESNQTVIAAELVREGVNVRLQWPATLGSNYEVDFKDNAQDAWQTHPAGVVVSGGMGSLLDSTSLRQRFYRVRLLTAP